MDRKMSLGRDISASEMMTIIARSYLATKGTDPRVAMAQIRELTPWALVVEYHRAVATLDRAGALSPREQREVREYAQDYLQAS